MSDCCEALCVAVTHIGHVVNATPRSMIIYHTFRWWFQRYQFTIKSALSHIIYVLCGKVLNPLLDAESVVFHPVTIDGPTDIWTTVSLGSLWGLIPATEARIHFSSHVRAL